MSEVIGAGAIIGAIMFFINQVPPIRNTVDYILYHLLPNERLSPLDYIDFYTRGLIDHNTAASLLTDLGLDNPHIDLLLKRRDILFNPLDLLDLYRRGIIQKDDYQQRITALGISKNRQEELEQENTPIPSVADLTLMAYRHAFEQDLIDKFGLLDEFPKGLQQWAAKLGMSEEVQQLYWMAHWHLPSFSEATYMYQRGIIDHDTFTTFMRDLDLPPYWREKMLQIGYNPIVRTDVKRMFELGVLDHNGVVQALQNEGYSPTDAANLAEYYAKDKITTVKSFTESQTLELYAIGAIDEPTAQSALQNIGYSQADAALLLELEVYKIAQATQKEEINTLTYEFKEGLIDAQTLSNSLDKLQLTAQQRQYYLTKATYAKRSAAKMPTKAELLKMYNAKIISLDDFKTYMSALGYSDAIISLYEQLYKITDITLIGNV